MISPVPAPPTAIAPDLPEDFRRFLCRVNAAGASHPEMPVQLVVLSRLLGHVAMRLEESFDHMMAAWDLDAWSWLALMVVYARTGEDVTPTEISRSLFLARANVTRVTDELVRRGLLHREPSTRDRRVLKLTLTEQGIALVHEIMPHAWNNHRAIWSGLDAGQLGETQSLLCAVIRGIESTQRSSAALDPPEAR
jgi:MarR family transcriptional repressor of emrRAB